jgi:hypothetical protein
MNEEKQGFGQDKDRGGEKANQQGGGLGQGADQATTGSEKGGDKPAFEQFDKGQGGTGEEKAGYGGEGKEPYAEENVEGGKAQFDQGKETFDPAGETYGEKGQQKGEYAEEQSEGIGKGGQGGK